MTVQFNAFSSSLFLHPAKLANKNLFGGQVKKLGKQTDISQFCARLDALGLQIIQVTADGNCFFRFVSFRLYFYSSYSFGYTFTMNVCFCTIYII